MKNDSKPCEIKTPSIIVGKLEEHFEERNFEIWFGFNNIGDE